MTGIEAATAVRPRTRHAWWLLAVGVLVVVVLVAWLVVGRTPHLATGSFRMADPEAHWVPAAETDSTSDGQSIVTDPSDGTNDAVWSLRNDGRVPIVVSVVTPQPAPMVEGVRVFVLDPAEPARDLATASDAVTLAPGQEVGVRISVGFGCASWLAGAGTWVNDVTLRVTTLGLTREVVAHWPDAVGVATTRDLPGTGCD